MIDQGLTIYSVLYLVTTLVSFFIAFLSWQRTSVKGARELTALMTATGIGAFCLIFETAAPTIAGKILWAKLEFIGGVSTPVLYLIFVLRFTGNDKFLHPRNILLLFIIPAITLALTFTNENHHLIWTGFSEISKSNNLIEYFHGEWFWVGYIAYTYLLLLWAAILLVHFIIHHTNTFRSQGLVVFIAGLFPWVASIIYLSGYLPVPGLDLPPLSIALSGILAAYAIFNIRFLDLIPVARETLVETLSDGILVLDEQNRIQDINEAARSFLGIDNKNIMGSLPESSGALYTPMINAVVDPEPVNQIEIEKANEIKTYRIIKKRIRNQSGSRLVVISDITSRIQAEEALKESETKYRKLVENSPDAIAIYIEGKIVFVNNECLRLMAAENQSDLMGKSVLQFVHPDSKALVISRMKEATEEGNVLPLTEEKFVRLDGSEVEVEVKAVPVRFGNKLGVQLIVRDITDRKRAEEELKEKKERYRGLSEASFEAIFITENGICIEQNLMAEKMFGYNSDEAIGRNVTDLISSEDRGMVMKNILAGYEEPYEAIALKKNGTIFPCLLNGKMMHYKGKNVQVTSLSDITDLKRTEKELRDARDKAEESDRLKSAFLANMSHEIRTPMNSILGFTDLLKSDNLRSDEQSEYIQIIQKGGDRLLSIINDIIDISKIESGQMEVSISRTNINEQIDYISSIFRPEVEGKSIKLITKKTLPENQATIDTDREKLIAILTNLVKNAIKFTSVGYIELGYSKRERDIEFYVRDTGTGIPHNQQRIIFDRFRQGSESLNRNYEGTGLGLSISKAYVELLGGKIRVESDPGDGSVFYFTIPSHLGQEPLSRSKFIAKTEMEGLRRNSLKILIADDDEASIILLTEAVKMLSKETILARTGMEAIMACRTHSSIDLVLMDIKMADIDGYEATRQIRIFNKDIIIIAQTALALTGDKERALDAGCNDYISKPINTSLLLAKLKKYFKK